MNKSLIGVRWGRRCATGRIGFLGIVFLALSLSACIVVYPQEWRLIQKVPEDTCPDVNGVFADKGELAHYEGEYRPSLGELLSGADEGTLDLSHIELQQEADQRLTIRAWKGDQLVSETQLSQADKGFTCPGGFLRLSRPIDVMKRYSVLGWGWDAVNLAKSSDGALVIWRRRGGFGTVIIFTGGVSRPSWYRFMPYGEGAPAAAPAQVM